MMKWGRKQIQDGYFNPCLLTCPVYHVAGVSRPETHIPDNDIYMTLILSTMKYSIKFNYEWNHNHMKLIVIIFNLQIITSSVCLPDQVCTVHNYVPGSDPTFP